MPFSRTVENVDIFRAVLNYQSEKHIANSAAAMTTFDGGNPKLRALPEHGTNHLFSVPWEPHRSTEAPRLDTTRRLGNSTVSVSPPDIHGLHIGVIVRFEFESRRT